MLSSSRCPAGCRPAGSRLRSRVRLLSELCLCELVALLAPCLDLDSVAYPAFYRQRLFTPLRTFWLFLAQVLSADGSCRETVRGALVWLCVSRAPMASPFNSAYCQARKRIKEAWLTAISRRLITKLDSNAPAAWRWLGLIVKLVDGSSVSMDDTPENQARWPQPDRQRTGCGFPVARIVAIFSLATGAMIALVNASLHIGEREMFRQLFNQVFQPGDVALADRGFCGFAEFHELAQRGVHCVMRCHARLKHGVGLRKIRRLGRNDVLMEWRRSNVPSAGYDRASWNALPESMQVREITVHVGVRGFRTQTIVLLTTLLDAKAYPAEAFAALYRRRWEVELDLRHIKTTLGMDILRCRTPDMIEKELIIHHILYNLIRSLMMEAAVSHGVALERLSFKGTLATARKWSPAMSRADDDEELARLHTDFLLCIARDPVPWRPNRREPRAIKRRPKNYARLVEPRAVYHEILHRNRYTKSMRGDE